jgi:hypothetical protein
MNTQDALDRLDTIQHQLARCTPVRGYRAATVAWTAALAGIAAVAQAVLVADPLAHRAAYLAIWVGAALVGILGLVVEIGRRYALTRSRLQRHGLLRTLFALTPAFGVAAVVTVALAGRSTESFALLPGLWMLCFCLAIYASLPRLPQGVGMIGCLYFAAGAWALTRSPELATAPWTMGCVFALGQAWAAWILSKFPEGAEFPLERRGGW